MESYQVLNAIKNALLQYGFDKVPDNADEDIMAPYSQMYHDMLPRLAASLQTDIAQLGLNNIRIDNNSFHPEDSDAQGATIIYINITASFGIHDINIAFKYLVFQEMIHCYIAGNPPPGQIAAYSNSSNKFVKMLAGNYKAGTVSNLNNFF